MTKWMLDMRLAECLVCDDGGFVFTDSKLGEYEVKENILARSGAAPILRRTLGKPFYTTTHKGSVYAAKLYYAAPCDTAKTLLLTYVREVLENKRMELNKQVRVLNEAITGIEGEL